MDLSGLAAEVGSEGPVGVSGLGSRGGAREGVPLVSAPRGLDWFQPDEMTVCCGAGTPVAELLAVLGEHRQGVALPPSGTVGGALAAGRSDVFRLGHGPVRETLLQARYVSAAGELITAGGPTVKNVTGFDLCRALVGSSGTLGIIGEVILRTRPLPPVSRWFVGAPGTDPFALLVALYRPASILWDGTSTWVCLEGDARDVAEQAAGASLLPADGPPPLPTGGRWSLPPDTLRELARDGEAPFVAEIGIGVVHHTRPPAWRAMSPVVAQLHRRIKAALDPDNRFGPLP